MAYFQTKNPDLGKFRWDLQCKILVYFMTIWSIVRVFGIFCGRLVYFTVMWYIFAVLVFCTTKNLATLMDNKTSEAKKKSDCDASTKRGDISSGLPDFLDTTYQNWKNIPKIP
jgi:hypothetical protein